MMFKSIRKKIFQWFRSADLEDCMVISDGLLRKRHPGEKANRASSADTDSLDSDGMNFKVINGCGGVAIEIRTRDSKTGDHSLSLYIIPEDHDLAQELAKIITIQTLKY